MKTVTVLGAGLAGSECAWQLAKRGINVKLIEMKPVKMTPAHTSPNFAELVCSNSLRSDELTNAVGLLKAEMRAMGSLIMESADANKVAAGGALAVDREGFSKYITDKLKSLPNVEVVSADGDPGGRGRHRDRPPVKRRYRREDSRPLSGQRPAFL